MFKLVSLLDFGIIITLFCSISFLSELQLFFAYEIKPFINKVKSTIIETIEMTLLLSICALMHITVMFVKLKGNISLVVCECISISIAYSAYNNQMSLSKQKSFMVDKKRRLSVFFL